MRRFVTSLFIGLAILGAAFAVNPSAASAQTLSQDTYYFYGRQAVADCTVTSALPKATLHSWRVWGYGNVSCGRQHPRTTLTVWLRASNGTSTWNVASAQTTFTNSYGTGSRWLATSSFSCSPYLSYQVVAQTTVSDIGTFYSTTGAPRRLC